MNREETLALYAQGRDAWNAWAQNMLDERAAMEKAGTWAAEQDESNSPKAKNGVTSAWMQTAISDFSNNDNPHTFAEPVDFSGFIFPGLAWFDTTKFDGRAKFVAAKFLANAWFGRSTFVEETSFEEAMFDAEAWFSNVIFTTEASFSQTRFAGKAHFNNSKFMASAWLVGAKLKGTADFSDSIFNDWAAFDSTAFAGDVQYNQVTYNSFVSYQDAIFQKAASFQAIRSERAFTLAGATFRDVPDFIQAHFAEAPRVDNLHFRRPVADPGNFWVRSKARVKRLVQGNETHPARYRALKRLAIQGHDHESEMQFFAGEITSARRVDDFPVPWRVWSPEAWAGALRWWFGWIYQLTSNFGRSLVRPFALWVFTIALGTIYFLGQTPDVARERELAIKAGAPSGLITFGTYSMLAWSRDQPCYAGLPDKNEKGELLVTGLAAPVRAQTNAATEAVHLAFRNAFIFLDGGSDAAHRTFGCLYGIERYGDNPVAIVPSSVTFASMLQKAFSGLLIFLFGLAVRNMLRMK